MYISTALCLYLKQRKPKEKWSQQWLLNRPTHRYINLMEAFRSFWLAKLFSNEPGILCPPSWIITPLIKIKNANMRPCITPTKVLRSLATGMNHEEVKFVTTISAQRLGKIIPETCITCIKVLKRPLQDKQNLWHCIFINNPIIQLQSFFWKSRNQLGGISNRWNHWNITSSTLILIKGFGRLFFIESFSNLLVSRGKIIYYCWFWPCAQRTTRCVLFTIHSDRTSFACICFCIWIIIGDFEL